MTIDEIIDNRLNKLVDDMERDYLEIVNEINEIGFKEANKIYDSFISQFYKYKTSSYIRHWEGRPGTCKGSNLYYAKNFKIHKGQDPYFELEIYDDKMADDYQHDYAFDIIDQIMAGANVITGSKGGLVWFRPWRGKYSSRYFKYTGTLNDALFTFIEEYDNMILPLFKRRWKKKGW